MLSCLYDWVGLGMGVEGMIMIRDQDLFGGDGYLGSGESVRIWIRFSWRMVWMYVECYPVPWCMEGHAADEMIMPLGYGENLSPDVIINNLFSFCPAG